MEKNNIKRLPVTRGNRIIGIVSHSNLLQAVTDLAREVPDPTVDDDVIREHIIGAIEENDGIGLENATPYHPSSGSTTSRPRCSTLVSPKPIRSTSIRTCRPVISITRPIRWAAATFTKTRK